MKNIWIGVKPMLNSEYTAVICAVNSKFIHSSLAPWCLLAGIKKWGIPELNTTVHETTINANPNEILQKIGATAPMLVAFSCYIWNIEYIKKLLPQIKKILPNTKIAIGGPEVSYNPCDCLDTMPQVDFVLCGEGEQPFAELLNCLAKQKSFCDIRGLCHRGNMHTEIKPNIPIDEPPSPYSPEYFAALDGRIAYLETSRGCPYSCAFCLSGRCGGVRFFDLENAKKQMILLANSGTQTIKLVDRTFNCNKERAKQLWQFVIDNYGTKIPSGVCFHFEIAGDILDEQSIQILQTAPPASIQLEIGMQSFYEPTLQAINRKTDTNILQKNIRKLLEKGNIHIHIDLIAGLELETLEIFKQSFNIAYSLKSHMLQLGFLKVLHGADLEKTADMQGLVYSQTPPYEIIQNNWLSPAELAQLHLLEDALERFANSGRFSETMLYLERLGVFDNQKDTKTPFDFYLALGKATNVQMGTSLDEYTDRLFGFLKKVNGVDVLELRDYLAIDRLCTNSTGRLPPCLKIQDSRLKNVVYMLANSPKTKLNPNTKRGVVLLASKQNTVCWVDYISANRHPLTKKWTVKFLDFKQEDL